METLGVVLLGATGTIGINTLDVLAQHPERFKIIALTGHTQIERLLKQCQQHHPKYVVLSQATQTQADWLREQLIASKLNTLVLIGELALQEIVQLAEVDIVVAAIVGAAGLLPTLKAIEAKKKVLLANKESLVMAGEFFMEAVKKNGSILLPIDSEHNAILQCLPAGFQPGLTPNTVERIILTASGGAARDIPIDELPKITPQQACRHPTWIMGKKISIDCATLMNKGFELIEAYWLFGLPLERMEILIHPQSVVHSLVGYLDGSLLAQLADPDMRIPIAYCLAWPERIAHQVKSCNLIQYPALEFKTVDQHRYPCLGLAYEAIKSGGNAATILNAANEVSVQAFLEHQIAFTDIVQINQFVLNAMPRREITELDIILEDDQLARKLAQERIKKL
jgi:1-deoxy-D-xylulose-5-phosphate reductoisomerase